MRFFDNFMFRFIRVVGPRIRWLRLCKGHRHITLPARTGTTVGHRSLPAVEFVAHPVTSPRLVIIYPGLNATVDGECRSFNQANPLRYVHLADRVQRERVAAVLRVANPPCGYYGGGQVAVDRLARVIDYALGHARDLCGRRHPELCLLGFSAGAGAAAALAGEYRPSRMLLVAPAGDAGPQRIIDGLKDYSGKLVLLVGERDEVVGRDSACLFDRLSPAAQPKEVHFVPDCDHFFTRPEHDQLLNETSLRVFAGTGNCEVNQPERRPDPA